MEEIRIRGYFERNDEDGSKIVLGIDIKQFESAVEQLKKLDLAGVPKSDRDVILEMSKETVAHLLGCNVRLELVDG